MKKMLKEFAVLPFLIPRESVAAAAARDNDFFPARSDNLEPRREFLRISCQP